MRAVMIIWLLCACAAIVTAITPRWHTPESRLHAMERLRLSASQVGVRERTGRNDGPLVEAYLRAAGARRGDPWCMALPVWAHRRVADSIGLKSVWPTTASTQTFAAWAERLGRLATAPPQPGDVIVWRVPGQWQGHAETLERFLGHGWWTTIAGNVTSGARTTAAIRDGGGCSRMRRNINHPLGRMFVRALIAPQP